MTLIRRSSRFRSRSRNPGWHWRGLVVGAVGAIAFVLAGCGSKSGSSGSSSASTGATGSNGSSYATTTSVSVPPYHASRNARAEVTSGHCTGNQAAGWVLRGTVLNSAGSSRTYSIVVDFITKPGDMVMATQIVKVGPLAPHQSANWSTPPAGQGHANLNCVIRQALWS
jgi:hypothetical protein